MRVGLRVLLPGGGAHDRPAICRCTWSNAALLDYLRARRSDITPELEW